MNITHRVARISTYSGSVGEGVYLTPVTLPSFPGIELSSARPETTPRQTILRTGHNVPAVGIIAAERRRQAVDRLTRAICRARGGVIPTVTEVIGE